MATATDMEQLAERIASMPRQDVTDRLLHFQADFPMDFTADYLGRLPLERLRHLLLAAHLYRARKERAGT